MLCAHMDEVGLVVTEHHGRGLFEIRHGRRRASGGAFRPRGVRERHGARRDLRKADPPLEGGGAHAAGAGRPALD